MAFTHQNCITTHGFKSHQVSLSNFSISRGIAKNLLRFDWVQFMCVFHSCARHSTVNFESADFHLILFAWNHFASTFTNVPHYLFSSNFIFSEFYTVCDVTQAVLVSYRQNEKCKKLRTHITARRNIVANRKIDVGKLNNWHSNQNTRWT